MAVRQKVVRLSSCFVDGIIATMSEIEISLTPGIPTFDIIGLCDSSIRESRGRISAAIRSCGILMPKGHITVNITPAYMHKSGSGFDLPIAIGILFIAGCIPYSEDIKVYAQGELSLNGEIKGTPGAILKLTEAVKDQADVVFIPEQESYAAACTGISCMPVKRLMDIINIMGDYDYCGSVIPMDRTTVKTDFSFEHGLADLKGQPKASEALVIACSGMHSILMLGSPGCGKSFVSDIISSLLPPPDNAEYRHQLALLELTGGAEDKTQEVSRPLRHIYPGVTLSKLYGKKGSMIPGELALADGGVLFADEICDFGPGIIDELKVPLEQHVVRVVKDGKTVTVPASFLFVAVGNPCRCGNFYEGFSKCRCTPAARKKYLARLSGGFIDRIDLFTEMRSITDSDMKMITGGRTEADAAIEADAKRRIGLTWNMQSARFNWEEGIPKVFNGTCQTVNADLFRFTDDTAQFACEAAGRSGMSGRGYLKLIRVARTIADMEGSEVMTETHVRKALIYRVNEDVI